MIRRNKGMTFVEIILVMVVIGATAFIAVPMIDTAIQAWSFVTFRSELWQTGEIGMQRVVQDAREIKSNSELVTATSSVLRLRTVANEDVTYSFAGSTLQRNNIPLLSDVNALSFSYYDASGNVIAIPKVSPMITDVRTIRIFFILGPTGRTFTLQTDVHPRNIN